MRTTKRNVPKSNPVFAVVVDGETECWYLQMLKRNERDLRVSIKPEIPQNKNLEDQYNLVCDLSGKEYTKVFWIVDLDTIIKENNNAPKSNPSPLKKFQNYRNTLNKKCENVVVIVNNPCLEFWFLLHFIRTSKYFTNCSSAETELKKHMKNYEKTKNYFTKQNDDIYLKLKNNLPIGLANSIALGNFDDENPKKTMCEMEFLFQSYELKNYFKL